ncbi:MAG: ATP-binding cassette domain-containing protein [Armatimonadetes bacterium]|jgi:iron complex transport system ATP-binding protein|nr:ATP-binding cassette domain-containing protein [Armatimonadota bacterium]
MIDPLLEFHGATVLFGGVRALDSITTTIRAGENVAIIGPNGSGKSTLIKLITRELYPLAGNGDTPVKILGESAWDVFKLRSLFGIVSADLQDFFRRPLIGRDVILSGFFGSVGLYPHHEVTGQMQLRADELLQFLSIEHLASKYMTEMSTGEARRMLIARALVHEPKALILDEPSNGLDPRAARKFVDSLRKIAGGGKSVILVTHHLPDIFPEISRVIMLKDGRIFADGPKQEALTSESLSELFAIPVTVIQRNGYYHLMA